MFAVRARHRGLLIMLAASCGVAGCGDDATNPPPPSAENNPPTANITTSSSSGSAPVGILLGGASSTDSDGQVRTWSWQFGDGSSASGAEVEHVYEDAGSYTVTLTVTDDDGASGQTTTTITVTAPADDEMFGVVWHDADNDGTTDAGETGASGIDVFLDENANGQLDVGEVTVTSGIGGIYRFTGVSAGSYTVTQSLPIGWTNTAAAEVPSGGGSADLRARVLAAQIIEGDAVSASEFPFQVSLQQAAVSGRQSAHFCGGTLVAPQWVMTASHCLDIWDSAADVEVLVGTHDFNAGGTRVAADSILVHPLFVGTENSFKRDMGLIKLSQRFEDTPRAFLVDSTLFSQIVGPFELATVIGWGRTQEGVVGSIPAVMQQIEIPILQDTECSSRYGATYDATMICAGFVAGGKSSCQGDSGGPLLLDFRGRWYEAGIVSWGVGCGGPNRPGVYARVSAMYSFLRDHIPTEPSMAVAVTKGTEPVRSDFWNFR